VKRAHSLNLRAQALAAPRPLDMPLLLQCAAVLPHGRTDVLAPDRRSGLSSLSDMTAAVAAAWPYSKHWAVTLAEASASCSAERQRPATMMFSPISGTNARYGTS
jgi:hypothetical protein